MNTQMVHAPVAATLLVALPFALAGSGSAVAQQDRQQSRVDEGLVAYWPFEEGAGNVAHDASGNGNDGMVHGASWVPGLCGTALSFDGLNDYVAFTSPVLNTPPYTVCAWADMPSPPMVNTYLLANGGESGSSTGLCLLAVGGVAWDWEFQVRSSSGSMRGDCFAHAATGATFGPVLLCGTWDGTSDADAIKFYVNAHLVCSDAPQTNECGTPQNLRIGCSSFNTYYFNGTLDEVRIYNGVLSANEICELYWSCGPHQPWPGDLNCDCTVDFGDINPFVLALTDPSAYVAMYPDCDMMNADVNGDGAVDFGDINPFVELLIGR